MMRCLYHTFAPSQALAVRSQAPSLHPEALQHQHTASSEEGQHTGVPTQGSLGQVPAVQGPPSPAEAQPPLTFATGPPGELGAGSRRQLPPPLALMSSSGFGNFQGSQECLLKCSRSREQKEQKMVPSTPLPAPPPFHMQKAICHNSDRLASPGRGDGCGVLESISPKSKMPLKSQGTGREQGQEVQGPDDASKAGP